MRNHFRYFGWTKNHPGHIVFLLDLSQSMKGKKIEIAMDALRQTCVALLNAAENDEGEIDNAFSTTIIGYNSNVWRLFPCNGIGDARELEKLLMATRGRAMFDYSEGGVAEPKWQTLTADAFAAARKDIGLWLDNQNKYEALVNNGNRYKPAPIVIHITDGHPDENDEESSLCIDRAIKEAEAIKRIETIEGNALLINYIINPELNMSIRFPTIAPRIPNEEGEFMKFIFESSSVMEYVAVSNLEGYKDCRFLTVNESDISFFVNIVSLLGFLRS